MNTPQTHRPTDPPVVAEIPSAPHAATFDSYDDSAPPIWEVLADLGKTIPDEIWADVPTDLSKRIDLYLYGNEDCPE
ncbi:MAG: hypothetical protein ACKN9T_04700 [Candidatus Methylumidiphilus sp.]